MKALRNNLTNILQKIRRSPHILLFLDYDGTLTPIVKRPDMAQLSTGTRALLRSLSKDKDVSLSVVSGRPLNQIKRLIGLKNIYYAGNHGLEIEAGGKVILMPEAKKVRLIIKRLKKSLSARLKTISNYEIEDKGPILSVHYRRVNGADVRLLKEIFRRETAAYIKSGKISVSKGKKVLEIRPPLGWNKGDYCRYLLKKLKGSGKNSPLAVYIGDDVTDEDAFKVLRRKGITLFVRGEKRSSCAEYYVDSPGAVKAFLELILKR
ncbi:MAG: trehalose-phosphatase [Candidatus Omnitrophica bacterium]|nr:trehalose-phosphatase [Candidatus Omnitrophota bacterium]